LATLTIYRGLANVLTEGQTELIPDSPIVEVLAEGSVGPVPIPALIGIAVIVGFVYLLRFTYFGRNIYAIGGNEEAARLAGIRVVLIKMSVYGLLGLTVGLATVLQTGRLAAASPTVGSGLELVALAAVLLGGTHLGGGQGSVAGTVVGVLLLATIHNGLTISGVSLFWQGVITGAVLLVAVGFDRFRRPWAQ
jgi:ribose transport system permease protein